MHDSAMRIGELVIQTYCDVPKARILEIGSMDVNGGLRDFAEPPGQALVNRRLEEGPAVDVIVKRARNFRSNTFFSLTLSWHHPRSSMMLGSGTRSSKCAGSHAPGGHVYVNAPSNGGVHRYPLDCWRFYPDAGLAWWNMLETAKYRLNSLKVS